MNTKIKFLIVLITIMFSFAELAAQKKSKVPKLPNLEKFNFDFDFDFEGLKMSLEEEKKVLKELKANLREQLKTIKEFDKGTYYELLRESKFNNMQFPFRTKNDKKELEREKRIFELDVASQALVAKYHKVNSNKKQNLKIELQKALSKLFDLKEEERKNEVKELEKELNKLRKSLNIRIKNKKEIVKRRLQDLLDEDEYLEWE